MSWSLTPWLANMFDRSLSAQDLDDIRKTLQFIGSSPIDGINYSSVSRNVGITKYKAEKFLGYLERSFLVTRVFPAGTNVLKEPKVVMQPPFRLLYTPPERAIGAMREDSYAAGSSAAPSAVAVELPRMRFERMTYCLGGSCSIP